MVFPNYNYNIMNHNRNIYFYDKGGVNQVNPILSLAYISVISSNPLIHWALNLLMYLTPTSYVISMRASATTIINMIGWIRSWSRMKSSCWKSSMVVWNQWATLKSRCSEILEKNQCILWIPWLMKLGKWIHRSNVKKLLSIINQIGLTLLALVHPHFSINISRG